MTATECFSGTCGLCIDCTNNTIDSFKDINNQNHELRDQGLRRADDLYKLIGKKYTEEIKERYNRNLLKWCKRYGYKDPYYNEYSPQTIEYTDASVPFKLKLIEERHAFICSDPYCKMLYVSSTSWEHKTRFPLIPMYTGRDNKLQICGPCMTNESFKN
jgi:hypothetical protein